MRDLEAIAVDVHQCATSWEPGARLIGNVRADEIAHLAAEVMRLRRVEAKAKHLVSPDDGDDTTDGADRAWRALRDEFPESPATLSPEVTP